MAAFAQRIANGNGNGDNALPPGPSGGSEEELRELLPGATIYILDGLFAGQAEFYAKLNLCPALISMAGSNDGALVCT